jgi:hypothetical protein
LGALLTGAIEPALIAALVFAVHPLASTTGMSAVIYEYSRSCWSFDRFVDCGLAANQVNGNVCSQPADFQLQT